MGTGKERGLPQVRFRLGRPEERDEAGEEVFRVLDRS